MKVENKTDRNEYIKWTPLNLLELEISQKLSLLNLETDGIKSIREEIVDKFGFIPPSIKISVNPKFKEGKYIIKLEDLEVSSKYVIPDLLLAVGPEICLNSLKGLEGKDPFNNRGLWITPETRDKAVQEGCTVYSNYELILEDLRVIIFKNIHRFLGVEEIENLLNHLRATHPALVKELIPSVFSVLDITRILKRLLIEHISLRPFINILETLGDYSHITRDSDQLVEYIRQSLGAYICNGYKDNNNEITVITADTRMERILLKGLTKTDVGTILQIDPEIRHNFRSSLAEHIVKFKDLNLTPIIVSSPETRRHIKRLSERAFPELVVLSVEEIPSDIRLNSIGIVSVEDAYAYIELGDQYYREGKHELAEAEYKRAVELDPVNARAHYALRLTYRKMGKLEMALNSYKKAIELDPKYEFVDMEFREEETDNEEEPAPAENKIKNLQSSDKNSQSPDELEIIIPSARKPKEIPVVVEESVYIDQERIEKMKTLNPSFATIFNKMGEDHLLDNNNEGALKEFDKAIELDPNYPVPHYNLGLIYFQKQDWFLCRKELEKAIELNSDYLEAYVYLGKLFKMRNMKDKAEHAFYRAWEIANKNSNNKVLDELKKELEELKI